MELSEEQKQKIVDELNSDSPEPELESNTQLFNMASMDELKPFLERLTPMEMFEKSLVMNASTLSNLSKILPDLSKKNIIKLFIATLKISESDAYLSFGGTAEDKRKCEIAFANSQLARNALIHVEGTRSMAMAKLAKKREEEEKQAEESAEDKGESNV